jgi:hypothetical protein
LEKPREETMKYALTALAAALYVAALVSPAFARCPPGTSYQCYQGYNGKVICGCR